MQWLHQVQRLQAIAQAGLTFATDPFDRQRYTELREIATAMAAQLAERPVQQVALEFAAGSGYPTPKVDVRAVIFDQGRLLLVRERSDGRWSLPGGWADIGESPAEIAVREVREEAGYHVRASRLLAVLDKQKHGHPPSLTHAYKLFIRCDLLGGSPSTSEETDQVGFFGPHELPPLSLSRVTEAQVRRMFEHLQNPHLPPDLD